MSDSQPEIRSRWGGPARLPLALSGLLAVVAVVLVALVVIGSGIDEPQIAQSEPGADRETQPETAAASPPAVRPEPPPADTETVETPAGAIPPEPAAAEPPPSVAATAEPTEPEQRVAADPPADPPADPLADPPDAKTAPEFRDSRRR